MTLPDLSLLPDIALSDDEPVFDAPWQAQAFAMAVSLHQSGAFTWAEWA
ncbi:MAG TPA: nitrile hydratase accessory protein, partial [Sulfitobacter pontiacus]|nr:nitrile hydratase accessory protein [Sulfitobacter pontiacus]HBR42840.1 nitrile hydratase accessory protein [Sulfitobacter pontiacus]